MGLADDDGVGVGVIEDDGVGVGFTDDEGVGVGLGVVSGAFFSLSAAFTTKPDFSFLVQPTNRIRPTSKTLIGN